MIKMPKVFSFDDSEMDAEEFSDNPLLDAFLKKNRDEDMFFIAS